MYAVRAVGSPRLRRTKSPRRQWGCSGLARGSHCQSYQRGPLAPSPSTQPVPALGPERRQDAFDLVLPPGPLKTYSLPETANTWAWAWASNHSRSDRLSP